MSLGFFIAISLGLGIAAWLGFLWSVRSGQYDDPEGPKYRMLDEDDQGTAIDLYVTNSSGSWGTLNSAPTVSDANARGIQAYIPIAAADFKDIGGSKFAQPRVAQNIGVICETSGSANLYIVGVCASGTPTYTASGLKIGLGFRQTSAS